MKPALLALTIAAVLSLGACEKTDQVPQGDGDSPPEPTASVGEESNAEGQDSMNEADKSAAEAQASTEKAEKAANAAADVVYRQEQQGKLDYATMEDGYLNDAKGQWASSATASSSYGSANEAEPDSQDGNTPWRATGAPDGDDWTNNSQNVGFDWIQLKYDDAVDPAEVRAVLNGSEAPKAITRIELIDTTGKPHVVWSGLSDAKRDERGQRTWFVRKVEGADYTADTVKLTFANNVASGYKTVDAVQLISK